MELPQPQTQTFSSLINDIEKGQIKIPQFQRDFVWTKQKAAGLLDSIIKGYPIGTFIFWRTKERLRTVKDIGSFHLPSSQQGEFVDFVLDGQQRLTSLFASLKGLKILRDNEKSDDFAEIFIDLTASEHEQIVVTESVGHESQNIIRVTDLLYGGLTLLASYPQEHLKTLEKYKRRIESYNYSIIQIKEAPIDIATEIFTRINVGGKPLTLFEIMVAKTFDDEKKFDLSLEFAKLIDKLKPINYETLSDASILQVISLLLTEPKECKRQVILTLGKDDFIGKWNQVIDAIERTIEYFRAYYRIPVSQLLPYNALIVPFAYFFFYHKDKPIGEKQAYLEDFFWRCALSARYSSAVETKLAQDVKRIDMILKGELPSYDWSIDTSENFLLENGWFSTGRSYIKALLCLYAYFQPKSFNDNSIVNISNYWLKQANSKNYHHFFPRAYLSKNGEKESYINHILNITIVDDFLNKRAIKAQAPSQYMHRFQKINPDIDNTMKTHLIEDLAQFGIWNDDYWTFLRERAKVVSRELNKRIIKQDIDIQQQPTVIDDYEEEITTIE